MSNLEGNQEINEDLQNQITETYGVIHKLFLSLGFFTKVLTETLTNFARYFEGKDAEDEL